MRESEEMEREIGRGREVGDGEKKKGTGERGKEAIQIRRRMPEEHMKNEREKEKKRKEETKRERRVEEESKKS